ncbi:unnamed protein product [Durusdinium trenchii]|uniref:Uncharacterized protein n=1 Tax=Durusdinium trenchii TaxID=1381693 RepID=A0ABP0T153_9DINO
MHFNHSLEGVVLPSNLQSLSFDIGFCQRLDKVSWPSGLEKLTLNSHFVVHLRQSLEGVVWPSNLQNLNFNSTYISQGREDPFLEGVLPRNLQSLAVSSTKLSTVSTENARTH